MASASSTRLGTVLFRLRSFTPVPVILLLAYQLWRSRGGPGPGGAELDSLLNWVGLAVALAGQGLRFYTLGQVPEGTSGQDNFLQARSLNTRGPYAHVRNPLYVGKLGIILGLLLIANDPWVSLLGLGFFFGQYFFIIRAEEAFLEGQHGEAYREFLAKVPRWVPRLTPAFPGRLRASFDYARGLKKGHNPFAAWALGALVLSYWELHARGALSPVRFNVLVGLAVTVVLAFGLIKAWKRRWLFASRA
ncbi:MAG: isoprenylcysteine carboxylmethyltransferase family protein [Myxococcota bacterium]|nr:isoprenylcysteine carboxylmethyltransferase family protein [Myxococcota bacterium]